LLDLTEKKGLRFFHELARLFDGWTRAYRGAGDEGIKLISDALAKLFATEQRIQRPYMISTLAETYLRAGRWLEAREKIDEALRLVESADERWYEAELHRLAGDAAVGLGERDTGERRFRDALAIARRQSARMWELRAAKRLAALWRDTGRTTEARALLEPVLVGFGEGFDTPDLREAKLLLDQI
jgi:predicted ATPase